MKHLIKQRSFHVDACTQFSIAMAYDVNLSDVVKDLGWAPVSTAQLRDFLIRRGLSAIGDSVDSAKATAKGRGLAIILGAKEGHAVAYEDGKIYDPNGHTFKGINEAIDYYSMITSTPWEFYTAFEVAPLKMRTWNVGMKKKEEAK